MALSLKSFTLAVILSVMFHLLISEGVSFVFPQQPIGVQPQFVFWGSILKSGDREDRTGELSVGLPSLDQDSELKDQLMVSSLVKLEKPVPAKVMTEKQNLKSSFEAAETEGPFAPVQIQKTTFTVLTPYKRLRFPSRP